MPDEPETFRHHLPTLAAASAGTVLAAVLGSFLGVAGTMAGMAAGSAISGTVAWFGDRFLRRSAQVAKAKRDAARSKRAPLTEQEETSVIEAVRSSPWRPRGMSWRRAAGYGAAAMLIAAVTVTAAEAVIGKPVADVVRHQPGSGLSFGGGGPASSPASSPEPSVTPSASPDPTDSQPSPSVTPAGSSAPVLPPSAGVSASATLIPVPPAGGSSP